MLIYRDRAETPVQDGCSPRIVPEFDATPDVMTF
jgi:hypothetical protein